MAFRRTLLPRLAAFSALILLATCQETPQIDSQAATALAPTGAAAVVADQRVVQQTPQRRRHYATDPLGDGELGCDDVSKLDVGDDKCAFVRKHCHSDSIINYPSLYFCYVTPSGAVSTALMLLGCVVLLALLFRIIARAADDFFSCILSQISQDLGLPPRLGGVTLLALGNGAPDLSASIAAVKSGNYQLAMGALTGAGMFVGGVVAGRIITLSGGVRARGAQLRDISTQFITVAVVTGIVASGWFTYGSVIILLSIYAAYVVVVAVADFSKRAGVEWKEVARKVSRRVSGRWTQLELASPLLQEDHGTEAAAGSGAPSGHSLPVRHAQQLGQAQEWEPEGSGQRQQEAVLDAAQLASAGSMPFPDAHSLPIMDEAGLPGRGSSPPPAAAGAELRPFTGGGSGCVSLPDLSAAAQQRQQQEARRPARYARQSAGHHRHRPPIARFEPQVPYSDLVQMPSWEYRQRALADMAQSKSFYARDSARRPRQRRIPEEGAEEEEEEQQGQQQQQQGPRGGWEEGSDSGSSEGNGEEEGEGDVERGWARSPGRHLRSTHASGSTSSGSRGTQGSYRPPLIGAASGSGAEDRPAGAKGCFASATAAVAAAAVAAVDAEAGAAPHSHSGRRHFAERLEGEEGAELQQLDRSAASTPHNSNCHSMGSFEMSRGAADAAAAAVAEADGDAWGSAVYARGGGSAQDTRPWEDGSLEDSLEEDEEQPSQLRRCLDAVQWPVLFLLTATIPLVEVNNYRRRWFLRSLAFSPLFVAAYLHLFTWQAALAVLCASVAMVTAGHLGTLELQDKAPLWCFGTGYPIGAALVALYGFAVAAMWISLFASEIVGLLQFFGMLSKIDPSVLGITVLAWGNSLMDYLNNTAMAGRSRGGNSMAMTACFAGPLFNMLVGLGLGFWALLQDTGAARTAVTLDPVVLVGCLFVMLNCAGLVGISLTHRQHLPAWCGGVMVGLYALYLSVVLAVIVCF